MTTEWLYQVYIFFRGVDATPTRKEVLARVYSDNGSGESLEDEIKMFDSATRLSPTGKEPATVLGLKLPAKEIMRLGFVERVSVLPAAHHAVVTNTAFDDFADGELIAASPSLGVVPIGEVFAWDDMLALLAERFNLKVIPPPDPFEGEAGLSGTVRNYVLS